MSSTRPRAILTSSWTACLPFGRGFQTSTLHFSGPTLSFPFGHSLSWLEPAFLLPCTTRYEWQQGPDPLPADRYRFDTHYPDYFPPRTNFSSTIDLLRSEGIYMVPYINGRLFDINSTSYKTQDGADSCCLQATAVFDCPVTYLANETYGSNATFHVADPSTAYWQAKVSNVVSTLVDEYHADSVYIDQLAAKQPVPDWSPSRNHPAGGGSWWTDSVNELLLATRANLTEGSSLVTEGIAEPYLATSAAFLVLTAFAMPMAGVKEVFVPAFPVVSPSLHLLPFSFYPWP
eukprot:m.637414 g.637414  ORF g.637414 m.637414 type:complete len:289 (-) comp58319_c0_seq26:970-1836(-)